MIAKPEVIANQKDLYGIAKDKGDDLYRKIESVEDARLVAVAAEESAVEYYKLAQDQTLKALNEVGLAAARHYRGELGLDLTDGALEDLVGGLIETQRVENYYGASLNDRMRFNYARLKSQLLRASFISRSPKTRAFFMSRVFHSRGPYGNHAAIVNRVLLSQSTHLEHEVAKSLGREAGVEYVNWLVSDHHAVQDVCDDLVGTYHIDNCPLPPHPNCQCVLQFVKKDGTLTKIAAARPVEAIRALLKRIVQRRKRH